MTGNLCITRTLKLPFCWVCGKRFVADGGTDPSLIRNEHHVVPRAYGGENGPTVTLCSADHDLLHALATRLIAGDAPQGHQLLRGLNAARAARVLYLAGVVCDADRATAGDPNRRFLLSLELHPTYRAKLDALKAALSCRSNRDVLQHLVDAEYQKRFPLSGL